MKWFVVFVAVPAVLLMLWVRLHLLKKPQPGQSAGASNAQTSDATPPVRFGGYGPPRPPGPSAAPVIAPKPPDPVQETRLSIRPRVVTPASTRKEAIIISRGRAASGATRTVQTYALPCIGGPAAGRVHLLTVDPAELLRLGVPAVWVPAFAPWEPTPELPPGRSVGFSIRLADRARMEIQSIGLYMVQETPEGFQLACEGTVDVSSFCPPRPEKSDDGGPAAKPETVTIQVDGGAHRRRRVFPIECMDGPAGGRTYMLPEDPAVLFENGLGSVMVTETSPRPADKGYAIGDRDRVLASDIGHVSIYALEAGTGKTLRCRFVMSLDAVQYLVRHRPKDPKPRSFPDE